MRRWLAAAALVPSLLGARSAPVPTLVAAQSPALPDSVLEERTAEVARTLRCPVCQGESIQESPADLAQQMRLLVRDMIRQGRTGDEIREYFVGRYGEWILLEPKATGLNILLYVLPFAVVIVGGVMIVWFVRRSAAVGNSRTEDRV